MAKHGNRRLGFSSRDGGAAYLFLEAWIDRYTL